MATKNKKKQNLRKQRNQAYDPLAPSFENQRQFRKAVQRRTQGQYRPQIRSLRREARAERRQSKGTRSQIRNDYRYLGDSLREAADRTATSNAEIMGQYNTGAQQSQQAMMNAITGMQGADATRAQLMGATNAPDTNQQAATAAVASQGVPVGGTSLGALLASQAASAADRTSDAALGRTRSLQSERDRLRSTLEGIQDERKDIIMGIPAIREAMRKAIMDEEIAKQSEGARQRIAAQSVDLDWARLSEDARQANMGNALGYAQLAEQSRMNTAQIKQARRELRANIVGATNDAEREVAKADSKRYESGVKMTLDYLESNNYKKQPNKTNPAGLFQLLRGSGQSRAEALHLMGTVGGPVSRWAKAKASGIPEGTEGEIQGYVWGINPRTGKSFFKKKKK